MSRTKAAETVAARQWGKSPADAHPDMVASTISGWPHSMSGRDIVRVGLADVLVWLGEEPPEIAWCQCIGPSSSIDPYAHRGVDHDDCGGYMAERCGGCYECAAMQFWYYRNAEQSAP